MKKLIALTLAILMAAVFMTATLAACSGGNGGDTDTPGGNGSAQQTPTDNSNGGGAPTDNGAGGGATPGNGGDSEGLSFQMAVSDDTMIFIVTNENLHESYDTTERLRYVLNFYAIEGGWTRVEIASLIAYDLDGRGSFHNIDLHEGHEISVSYSTFDIDYATGTVTVVLVVDREELTRVMDWDDYSVSAHMEIGSDDSGIIEVYPTEYVGDISSVLNRFDLPGDLGGGDILANIPDRGAQPYVEPPLESHIGDKGYFYATTDDYVVYAYDYQWIDYKSYFVSSFDSAGNWESGFFKKVFKNEADATAYMDQYGQRDEIQVDNVVYTDLDGRSGIIQSGALYTKEQAVIALTREPQLMQIDGDYDYYISKP